MCATKNDVSDPARIAVRVLASALVAADFLPVKDLVLPKSKLRLAVDRGVPMLIERELPRSVLDPEVLGEADRAAYESAIEDVGSRYGERIEASPFEPPRELIEEIAERAISKGSYASASDALEYLGVRNKRIGDLVASALQTLKTGAPSPPAPDGREPGSPGTAGDALLLAARLKNPLEPLFQTQAIDFHFRHAQAREKFYKALVTGNDDEVVGIAIDYLLGNREISEAVRGALTRTSARKAFLRGLAVRLSGGPENYGVFLERYRASVDVLRSGGEKPDPAAVQNALAGGTWDAADGIGLLESLAVTHPVSALVCRTILVPRQGHYLIPTVFEGNSAVDVLGLA